MIMETFLLVIYGLIFGLSSVIPGVSGGTMMISFGCHDLVTDILEWDTSAFKAKLPRLIPFVIGAALGAFTYAVVLGTLFETYGTACLLFFAGFIAGSIPLAFRAATENRKRITAGNIILFLIALGISLVVGAGNSYISPDFSLTKTPSKTNPNIVVVKLTNHTTSDIGNWYITFPEGKVSDVAGAVMFRSESLPESVMRSIRNTPARPANAFSAAKSADYNGEIKPGESVTFTYSSRQSDRLEIEAHLAYRLDFVLFFKILLGTFVAAAAAITPGISASFIMMLFGIYATLVSSMRSLDILLLLPAAAGIVFGIMIGAKAIRALLRDHYAPTYSVILGLFLGSIYIVFPKELHFGLEFIVGVGAAVFGAALSMTLGAEKKSNEELKKPSENL